MNPHRIFWMLTTGIGAALLIPLLVQDGMFLDGVTYSAISKNLAHGTGSLWKPHYTQVLYPEFYEHPPLVFALQALFFMVLGDGFYTERIFTLFTALFTAWGIILCWRLFSRAAGYRQYAWLPVLLWISVPVVFWSYRNNLLENTMGAFTLFAVYFISRALLQRKVIWLIPGGLCIAAAFLSKGFTGLFPLAAAALFGLTLKTIPARTVIGYNLIILILPAAAFYGLLLIFPGLEENIRLYIQQQLVPALKAEREVTTGNRFSILLQLLLELTLPLVLLLFFTGRAWVRKKKLLLPFRRESLFFLLTGISASLPLIVSLKQRAFYLIPALPFFSIALSMLMAPYIKNCIETLSLPTLNWLKRVSVALLAVVCLLAIFKAGKYSRDEQKLQDVYTLAEHMPEGTVIATTQKNWSDWGLTAYMSRIGYLSLDCCGRVHDYFLIGKNETTDLPLNEYHPSGIDLEQYVLLKKKNSNNAFNSP